jgi:hypothetical protein
MVFVVPPLGERATESSGFSATLLQRGGTKTIALSVAVSSIYVSKPHTGSVTIGNQDRHSGCPTQAAARYHIRVLLGVNIGDINDPRAADDLIDAGYSVVVWYPSSFSPLLSSERLRWMQFGMFLLAFRGFRLVFFATASGACFFLHIFIQKARQ